MKKLTKKLTLAKETLRNLEAGSLENVLGASLAQSNCGSGCTLCQKTACANC